MQVPFVDLNHIHTPLLKEFQKIQNECIKQSDFITGRFVQKFEEEFATYCESKYCVGASSGTAALFLTLKAMGIIEGDEVIVPSHTFVATAMAVSQCGATPIFTDVDDKTWNITWENISDKITTQTKAIIVVHIYGSPIDMDNILSEAKKRNILVIEDACQAHGAYYQGKRIGSLADAACFSFYPSKNLGALGEGGAVVTNDENLYQSIRMWRDYGRSDKYKHDFVGYNMRLQGIQAGFLSVKLPHLDSWNEERRQCMHLYQYLLKDTDVLFQEILSSATPVYHLGVIQSSDKVKIIQAFDLNQIGYGIHYPIPCHHQDAYIEYNKISLPIAEKLSQQCISLPLYVGLKEEQVRKVAEVVKSA